VLHNHWGEILEGEKGNAYLQHVFVRGQELLGLRKRSHQESEELWDDFRKN